MNEEVQNWMDSLDIINRLRLLASEVVNDELSEVLNKAADLMEPVVCSFDPKEEEDLEEEEEYSVFVLEISHHWKPFFSF